MVKTAREFLRGELFTYLLNKKVFPGNGMTELNKAIEHVLVLIEILEFGGYLQIRKRKNKNFPRNGYSWNFYERFFLAQHDEERNKFLKVLREKREERLAKQKGLSNQEEELREAMEAENDW